jgi:acetyl-CoA C-acetyltransferase
VQARVNAQANPKAIFHGKPITIEDVMRSPRICDPLKLLEIVMPCFGGGALVITTRERAERARHRPVLVSGFGEHLTHKSITYAPDLLDNPIRVAAERAFAMAGASRDAVDLVNPYSPAVSRTPPKRCSSSRAARASASSASAISRT